MGSARDEKYLMAGQRAESDRARASNTIQCGINHALVAERLMLRFFVRLRLALPIRQVGYGMHGSTLLAKAEQQDERKNQE